MLSTLRARLFGWCALLAHNCHLRAVARAQSLIFLAQSFELVAGRVAALDSAWQGAGGSIEALRDDAELDLVLAHEAWRERLRLLRRSRRLLLAAELAHRLARLAIRLAGTAGDTP
jgi:hypothetical protein